ncbi:MAG: T9SS type A sorting domain-containing protein [Candidatus Celaenobacter antarcticus]|nr:T9SS type A sorting domain-containing protein [Candidatus Celaenobacter antarcticus]
MKRVICTFICIVAIFSFVSTAMAQNLKISNMNQYSEVQVSEKYAVKDRNSDITNEKGYLEKKKLINKEIKFVEAFPNEVITVPETNHRFSNELPSGDNFTGGRWGNDVIIMTGSIDSPNIARIPGSDTIMFTTFSKNISSNNSRVYLYKVTFITNTNTSWDLLDSWLTDCDFPTPDIAVTNEYIYIVYSEGFTSDDWDVKIRKYSHSGYLEQSYYVAWTGSWEGHPSITTDVETWSSYPWIYVVWEKPGVGNEIYFQIFEEDDGISPVIDEPIHILGVSSIWNWEYPDIVFDNSGSNRVHVVCWHTYYNKICYRGALNFGNDPNDWEDVICWEPPSGYEYRLPHVDAQDDRVLIAWEKFDDSYCYQKFAWSTSGGLLEDNFILSGFSTEYYRPIPVISNTSDMWYMVKWKYQDGFKVYYNYTDNPSDDWYYQQISDNSYSSIPWYSFAGITFGDEYLNVIWGDGSTHIAFDSQQFVGIDENNNSTFVKELENFPNPFSTKTSIKYSLQRSSNVKIQIYNARGKLIETLIDSPMQAGIHTVDWSSKDISSGIYFCKLITENGSITKKMLFVK